MFHVLSEISKSAPATIIQPRIDKLMAVVKLVESSDRLTSNTVIRKFIVKLSSRIALRTLPGVQRKRMARTLNPTQATQVESVQTNEEDVSETVELALERLFNFLQDRDTVVRWSAAKGVARTAERLPAAFVDQVIDTVTDLFSIHSITAASMYELPAIAEATWHGASLACAEITRRGLFHPDKLPTLIDWMLKALYFDLRKGAHSIGSNVRDAAAYTIWSLARVQDPSVLSPYAKVLSQALVKVALFDREVQIRRAASAAFQEHVGRTSLFPHGIDVLRKTDFYAVSIRRNSFTAAAPQVAEHEEYRYSILEHLLDVTLRHWDRNMRDSGAESVRLICLLDMNRLPNGVVRPKMLSLLKGVDSSDIHGGITALAEVAVGYRQILQGETLDNILFELFPMLSNISYDTLTAQRNGIVTEAACRFISLTITKKEIELGKESRVPRWRQIMDYGIKHRTAEVQEQGAEALSAVSKLTDCSKTVLRLIKELRTASPLVQQSLGTVLGKIAYDVYSNALPEAIECILQCVGLSGHGLKRNVEARRNCYMAIPRILSTTIEDLPQYLTPNSMNDLFNALLAGLEDYTIDERGDVGSWIRVVCVHGLKTCSKLLIEHSSRLSNFSEYLPPEKYQAAVGGILKQGVEKLDNVRYQAGKSFLELLRLPLPNVQNADKWGVASPDLLNELFGGEEIGWNDGVWLFPRAVRLLEIERYQAPVLHGLVLSLSSKTDVTQRNVSESLSQYVAKLPVQDDTRIDIMTILSSLLNLTKGKLTVNAIVIPVLQTLNVLLSGGALSACGSDEASMQMLRSILQLASRGVDRLRNIQRINECMHLVIHLLSFPALYEPSVRMLPSFLAHQYPTVRSDAAEKLYILLQGVDVGRDTDGVEEVLLGTEWSCSELEVSSQASSRIVELLLQ